MATLNVEQSVALLEGTFRSHLEAEVLRDYQHPSEGKPVYSGADFDLLKKLAQRAPQLLELTSGREPKSHAHCVVTEAGRESLDAFDKLSSTPTGSMADCDPALLAELEAV